MLSDRKARIRLASAALIAVLTFSVLAVGISMQAQAGLPASKHAVAGAQSAPIMADANGTYPNIPVLSTQIKTSEQKDLVISFSAEAFLATDTRIKGKGTEEAVSQDTASILVWATVDDTSGVGSEGGAFPNDVVFAERIQVLKGKLSEWIAYSGNCTNWLNQSYPCFVEEPEEVELILNTTSANSFNFIALNVGSGVHTVTVWATIELVDNPQAGVTESQGIAAAIGDRTLVVSEVRLIQDTTEVTNPGP